MVTEKPLTRVWGFKKARISASSDSWLLKLARFLRIPEWVIVLDRVLCVASGLASSAARPVSSRERSIVETGCIMVVLACSRTAV